MYLEQIGISGMRVGWDHLSRPPSLKLKSMIARDKGPTLRTKNLIEVRRKLDANAFQL